MVNILFYICDTVGFLRLMYVVRLLLTIIRFVVPIILVDMTVKDLFQNVINPNEKDGLQKIYKRVAAGVIVFFVPTLISLTLSLIDTVFNNQDTTNYKASNCYKNANNSCIKKVSDYLDCEGYEGDAKESCINYRRCNGYSLSDSCNINTEKDEKNCKQYIEDTNDIYNVQGS